MIFDVIKVILLAIYTCCIWIVEGQSLYCLLLIEEIKETLRRYGLDC